ncbi:unnamed protein product [Didymodactylos carnosus]|uniref:Uncharacterized protein n=1 Tax=Didymodactylos carnosus TaxID=1234261 RepID=A0A814DVS7_9BILA|nr:unnamed protein product [Didymodactylos carnosus]CAF3733701.1 unnamed protein product [Didymodactylos carnosus]
MPTSVHTHDYDGELRQKWFEIRPMLLEKHLPESLPFQDTLEDIRSWLNSKYTNVKRFKRAHRSVQILETQRHVNFDNKNEINVEELLPILWSIVKKNPDLYDTFYEQLCDITGGSCSQGRSTRLFQFLFLFDTPQTITTKDETINSTENGISSNIDQ